MANGLDQLYARFAPDAPPPQPPPDGVAMDIAAAEPGPLDRAGLQELKRQFANEPAYTLERVRKVYDAKITEEELRDLIVELELAFTNPEAAVAQDLAVELGLGRTVLPKEFKFPRMDLNDIPIDPSNCRFETKRDAIGWALNAGPFWLRGRVHQPKATFRWAEDHQSLFHYPLPASNNHTRMALFADAGTGLYHSRYIGRHIMSEKPDLAIYHGDVYYSGKSDEFERRFTGDRAFKGIIDSCPLFTLNANHEMFSRGAPFFASIRARHEAAPALHRQEGSYFCLRAGSFQVIGIDTSYHDSNRHKEEKLARWLQRALVDGWAEGYSTILCSSDEPYSLHEGDVAPLFADVLRSLPPNAIDVWVFGNVHFAAFFDRLPEKRATFLGACIGHGGYPYTRKSESDYVAPVPVRWLETEARFPKWTDVRQDRGNNGFMMVDIDHAARTVQLRFVDWTGFDRYMVRLQRRGTERPLMIIEEKKYARAECR
jgi:hypothetical protein